MHPRAAAALVAACGGALAQHHGPADPFAGSGCSCTDFCAAKCAINASAPRNVTMYRMTPLGTYGATDKNTGDARGDTSYVIQRRTAAYDCKQNKTGQGSHCDQLVVSGDDQNSTDLIIAFNIEVDGQWGPYLYCNPTDAKHPSAPWDCDTWAQRHNQSDPYDCNCPQVHHAVGRKNLSVDDHHWPGGEWYSTTSDGQCAAGGAVGDGGCTWRVASIEKAVNATCVYSRIDAYVEARSPTCFAPCPRLATGGRYNHSTDCYSRCFYETTRGMSRAELDQPWLRSFATDDAAQGGCPAVRVPPAARRL